MTKEAPDRRRPFLARRQSPYLHHPPSWRTFTGATTLALLLLVAACAPPMAVPPPGGPLDVVGSSGAFDLDSLPDDWVLTGDPDENAITSATLGGVPTVQVTSGRRRFQAVRRTNATLLATPYLSWSWMMQPGRWQTHPVAVVVGFNGGSAKPDDPGVFGRMLQRWRMPPHDRIVVIEWGPSALGRGHLTKPRKDAKTALARYVVRGGAENAGRWWRETVDLALIYGETWPQDSTRNARVAFIGVRVEGAEKPLTAYLSAIRLSR